MLNALSRQQKAPVFVAEISPWLAMLEHVMAMNTRTTFLMHILLIKDNQKAKIGRASPVYKQWQKCILSEPKGLPSNHVW